MLSRRNFLVGTAAAVIAGPVIVKTLSFDDLLQQRLNAAYAVLQTDLNRSLYGELCDITRKAFVPRLYAQLYSRAPFLTI